MKKAYRAILVLLFFAGACLFIYPLYNYYRSNLYEARLITSYDNNTEGIENKEKKRLIDEARNYNNKLRENGISWQLSDEEKKAYDKYLRVNSTDVMSYIDIPSIDCLLPIYHGTEEQTLQIGAGHIMGTSLPVGGEGTHCVISGHTGVESAKLFTDLDKIVEGDIFMLHTLDETYTYEVDQIRIVEPTDLSYFNIEEGKDYCTLVTCTPYGINTHRLLVRGHRISLQDDNLTLKIVTDASAVDKREVTLVIMIPILFVVLLSIYIKNILYKKEREN